MKHLLLTLFLLAALYSQAQDVIKVSGSDPINCKILSVSKDEIVFVRNGIQRKANTAYVEYYKFNETVKEKIVPDSIPFVQTAKDTLTNAEIKRTPIETDIQPQAADLIVDAGRSFRSGYTFLLLGSACMAISPLGITTKEVDKEGNVNGIKYTYTETETDYTGMFAFMGIGVALNVVGIVELFSAANDLEKAGNKMKNPSGLSFNGSLRGIHIAYRF